MTSYFSAKNRSIVLYDFYFKNFTIYIVKIYIGPQIDKYFSVDKYQDRFVHC